MQSCMKRRALTGNDVHVLCVDLDNDTFRAEEMVKLLSEDEKMKARRFRLEQDRRRYVISRAVLRMTLSSYAWISPEELQFFYGSHGKPFLSGAPGNSLRFSLSHSRNRALFAVTMVREVGIDLEKVDVLPAWREIAERFYTSEENTLLEKLPEHCQSEAFYSIWVRKEALVKAKGESLAEFLDKAIVSKGDKRSFKAFSKSTPFSVIDLKLHPGFVAALAVEGKDFQVSMVDGKDIL